MGLNGEVKSTGAGRKGKEAGAAEPPGGAARLLPWAAAALLVAFMLARLWLLRVRGFDPDELQHTHGAWLISKGFLPYRDYFEHHTPWLHFFLSPFLALFRVETNPDSAVAYLTLARVIMWVFSLGILGLTLRLGMLWRDRVGLEVGTVAAVLLAGAKIFQDKTLEIRPDVPAAFFWLLALVLSLYKMRNRSVMKLSGSWILLLAGAGLGAAVMCTQKLLMAAPGFALGWFFYLRSERGSMVQAAPSPRRDDLSPLASALYLILGCTAPIALTLIYFAFRGGLGAFLRCNFLLNAGWSARLDPRYILGEFVTQSPILAGLGLLGILFLAGGRTRRRKPQSAGPSPEDLFILANLLGLLLGLLVLPIAWPQYYLSFLPLLALVAAAFIRDVWARGFHGPIPALMLVLASVQPFLQLRQSFAWRNDTDLAEIRYVLENSTPHDTILDGWSGRGVFRPHAWYYFFLHNEVRAMLTEQEIADFLADLHQGSVTPELVIFDDELRALSPDLTGYLTQHYRPAGVGRILRRK